MGRTVKWGHGSSYWMRMAGLASVFIAAVLFIGGVFAFILISEVAFIVLIFAFGVMTFGTGALVAARRM